MERIVSSLGKFTEEIGVRYMFDCRVEETGLLGWFLEIQSVANISFSAANSYKKHAWINLRRRRSGLVNEEGTNFNFISIAWPHVVMFEVIGTDLN